MDVNSFIIYLHELRNQCLYTHSALTIFNQSLQQNSQTGALFAGQAALSSASQVGAILWPTRARARRRGEVLREKLSLPESHALGDRRFVELWERSDEKLDDWIRATKGERVLFDFVGDPKTIDLSGLKEEGIYRLYDTTNRIFVLRGIGYNMENLAKATEEIRRRTELLQDQIMDRAQITREGGQAEEPANNDTVIYDMGAGNTTDTNAEAAKTDNSTSKKTPEPQKIADIAETDKAPDTVKADKDTPASEAKPKTDTKEKAARSEKTRAKKPAAKKTPTESK